MLLKNRTHSFIAASALFALLLGSGCAPTVVTRGNMISDVKMQKIQPVTSSRADVEQAWGPPTSVAPFDQNTWYYIGETTTQEGIFAPEVEKRKMIRVTFDQNDMITDIAEISPDQGRNIEIVERKTPTAGKDFTVLQQFIGNLGKYNTDDGKNR